MELRIAEEEHLKFIRKLYKTAFPKVERKPFSLILRQRAKGMLEIWVATDGEFPVGFAITAVSETLILLDYLAVSETVRSKGYGSEILKALSERYRAPIFLEIEKPDANAKNQSERLARKSFYLRNGYHESGILVLLWGVKMEILTTAEHLTYQECDNIYRQIYGLFHDNVVCEITSID